MEKPSLPPRNSSGRFRPRTYSDLPTAAPSAPLDAPRNVAFDASKPSLPQPAGPVLTLAELLTLQDEALGQLLAAVESLNERLSPVLSSDTVYAMPKDDGVRTDVPLFNTAVATHVANTRALCERVRDITARLRLE